jgi:hypothetical protein
VNAKWALELDIAGECASCEALNGKIQVAWQKYGSIEEVSQKQRG